MPLRKGAMKQAIVAAAHKMQSLGLSPGRSGNISVRWKQGAGPACGGMLITASGILPADFDAEADIVFVDGAGKWAAGGKAPSSEWRFHLAIYEARPDAGAVVHCHSRFATALACAHLPIPSFHYMVAKGGGADIPLAPYATYGTPELAAYAATALASRNACLLANHGQIAIGEGLEDAVELAEEVEVLAAQYVTARLLGEPVLLPADEMAHVAEKFKSYGKAANPHEPGRAKPKPASLSRKR
jgi:ribulose-5-phosphate 4-epimerase/fuculose-1-phosphate aldolase